MKYIPQSHFLIFFIIHMCSIQIIKIILSKGIHEGIKRTSIAEKKTAFVSWLNKLLINFFIKTLALKRKVYSSLCIII